jgi:heptosyltransferase II
VKRLDSGAVRKILIRGTNWVGDAIMSIPAMREVRRLFPESHISLLVRPWVSQIYSAVDFVDEVLEFDKSGIHRGWVGYRRITADLKSRRFDLAILLQNAFEAAFLAWSARIPARVGYRRDGRSLFLSHSCRIDPEIRRVHQAYYYLGILSGVGLTEPCPWNRALLPIGIGIREEDRKAAIDMLHSHGIDEGDTIVTLNPGAFYGEAKRWFPDRYAQVADALTCECGARIVIIGAGNDLPVAKEVASRMRCPAIVLAARTTLGQLMGLIKESDLLITNDSGPMHLAAALGTRQVAIFGSTSEVATGPLHAGASVVKHPVECNPCFLRKCPTDFRCMKGISVLQVLDVARNQLTGGGL